MKRDDRPPSRSSRSASGSSSRSGSASGSRSSSPASSSPGTPSHPSAPESPPESTANRAPTGLESRLEANVLPALVCLAALALLVRLVALGDRVAHWDEGRVAYDTLRYAETGLWEYRPIVHGPFLPHVNDVVFTVLGPTDFSMRLVVAVGGGLLPLAPWLFREHLRPVELVATSCFLAFTPLLVYYSRFMRNDVLVATFMLFALGTVVRFLDTRRVRYLYAAIALAALGFTTKENAIVYVLCWLGAGALLVDTALFRPYARVPTRASVRDAYENVRGRVGIDDVGRWIGYYASHLAFALALGVLVLVFFYAPRTGGTGVGFERLASSPELFTDVIDRAFADFSSGLSEWGEKGTRDGDERSAIDRGIDFTRRFLWVLETYAPALVVFAVAGIVGERYVADRPRPIVMLFAYWGLVSLPGYAIGMDIWASWGLVHVLVPLAVPAGVALGWVLAVGLEAIDEARAGDRSFRLDALLSVGVVALVIVSMLSTVGATAFDPTNTRTDGDHIVQYAQPNQEVRGTLSDLEAVLEETDEPAVYYGGLAIDNESAAYRPPVTDRWTERDDGSTERVEDNGNWYSRLPLPWYLERAGAERQSAHTAGDLEAVLATDSPAVIVAHREDDGTNNERVVDGLLRGELEYEKVVHEMRAPGDETVFYVRADLLESLSDPSADWEPIEES